MHVLLSRSVLPSLTTCCIQRACLVRHNQLARSAVVCRAAISTQPVPSKATGQVISKEANFVTVRLNDRAELAEALPGPVDLLCSVRALLKKIKQTVLVGDNVQVDSIDWADKRGVVQEVFKRHSEMSDPAMANVDQIVLVMSLNLPPFDARQATRFLVSAEAADIPVMLLLNKADLLEDDMTKALVAEVEHWGYQAIAVSVATGQGMTQLALALDGRISAVAGPSGVGKSSIINALRLTAQRQSQQAEHAQHAQHAGNAEQHAQQTQHGQQAQHEQQPQQIGNAQQAEHAEKAEHAQHARTILVQTERMESTGASFGSNSPAGTASIDDYQITTLDTAHSREQDVSSSHDLNMQDLLHGHSDSSHCPEGDAANQPAEASSEGSQLPTPIPSQREQLQKQWLPPQAEQSLLQQQNHLQALYQHRSSGSASTSQDLSRQSSSRPQPRSSSHDSSNAESPSWHSTESHEGHTSFSASLEQDSASGAEEGERQSRQWGSEGAGEGVQLQSVGAMSNIGRGMHTTRHVALLKVGNGLLADTPGFNVPSLTNLTVSNLQACFPEIDRRLESHRCAFSNCQHIHEPGCCVREDFDRHPIYIELYHEVKQNEDLERHRSMSKKRRQGTVRFKSGAGGEQTREALLETKTHRRVNRRQTRQGMQELIDRATQDEGG